METIARKNRAAKKTTNPGRYPTPEAVVDAKLKRAQEIINRLSPEAREKLFEGDL